MVCQKSVRKASIRFKVYPLALLGLLTGLNTGCSISTPRASPISSLAHNSTEQRTTLAEGSLSLTRSAPAAVIVAQHELASAISQPARALNDIPMVGLVPGSIPALLAPRLEPVGIWLSVDPLENKISVVDSGTKVFSASYTGTVPQRDSDAEFSVLLKQRNAVWFAPDTYYSARGLSTPPVSSRDRYLKGALGDFVVYLAEDFAIYSGPVDVPEISGIRLDPRDLARLYYLLPVGSKAIAG